MATPPIPPRPSRNTNAPAGTSSSHMDVPKIPPRPKRSVDRSISPNRDTFARSPLNDPAFLHNASHTKDSYLSADLPPRPPSVTLPSIGQEGSEYASFEDLQKTLSHSENEHESSPQQTKKVAGDLPLYAPTASVPSSTAKSRIQTVTRTDSSQAAAAGFGKLAPDDRSVQGPGSGRSDSSAGKHSRPSSINKDEEEQGIPEIGVQVPMYPNAGDVQAPTPSPYDQGVSTGVGFFNKSTPGRHHNRTKSGREIFHGPPGSYGLHGHGIIPKDDFEQSWYAKHPEDFKREKAGEYGPHIQENRKDYHWVGDKLEKLVHSSEGHGLGAGTSREVVSTPDEHIGYIASEQFASRMASPRPTSGRPASIKNEGKTESSLRHVSASSEQGEKTDTKEVEDEDVIHIDPPAHPSSKYGGGGYDPPTEDLGPEGGNTKEEGGWVSDLGRGTPILASDELEKNPAAEWRQPAVSPELERRGSGEYTLNEDGTPAYITKQRTHSRNSSKNNPLRRFGSNQEDRGGTPLESHKEYEPLFPEDEESEKKPKTAADKFKRPELARHHFPSQDVWEDTPSSLQLETTVDTPQAEEEPETPGADDAVDSAKVFEKPEKEQARQTEFTEEDKKSFLPEQTKRFAKSHLNKQHLDTPSRPGMQQRFPSQDVWEDAPDHGQLVTTVSGPQEEDTNEYADESPIVDKGQAPAPAPAKPSIPARPQKPKDFSPIDKKTPTLPEKPKPQIPARPSKPLTKSSEKVPTLESQASESSHPKPKPPIPARPGGSKIAALKGGFLADLNSKLGLGPQAPKVKEPEQDKEDEPPKPLQDARKGRAKGPQRRKPAASPALTPAATAEVQVQVQVPKQKLVLAGVSTVWRIGEGGEVDVPAAEMARKISMALKKTSAKKEDVDVDEGELKMEVVGKEADGEPEDVQLTKTTTAESEVEREKSVEKESGLAPVEMQGGCQSGGLGAGGGSRQGSQGRLA
ncbi:hypothetical protein P154DRAFT_563897 [Amniculicola lignicola CBS 123094]|uniref:Altered inheritance of mitochondria protein 21 n=1 Tax=Amniculicola lignicola CBS 123094 TaxID=1392246 RepID=A0A6A5WCN7_9PLEO|nr:hypothetical protein P154DRAFT_563897 [Amniculicola lignicola CBS 123094]